MNPAYATIPDPDGIGVPNDTGGRCHPDANWRCVICGYVVPPQKIVWTRREPKEKRDISGSEA